MEENNARAPTTVSPRIKDHHDARARLGKKYGRGGAHVSAESQTVGDVEGRVARERRARISRSRRASTSQAGCRADSGAGAQNRPASHGDRFFKKSLAAFQGASPARRRQWRHQLYEQIQEAAEAEAAVRQLCQAWGVSRAGYYRFRRRAQTAPN